MQYEQHTLDNITMLLNMVQLHIGTTETHIIKLETLLRSWLASVNSPDRDEITAHLVADTKELLAE